MGYLAAAAIYVLVFVAVAAVSWRSAPTLCGCGRGWEVGETRRCRSCLAEGSPGDEASHPE